MKAVIGFKDFKILCIVGVHPHERQKKQILLIDLAVEIKDFGTDDKLEDTFNYEDFAEICNRCSKKAFNLIESLARNILNEILSNEKICKAKITIKKPAAFKQAKFTFAELEREK